MNSFLANKDSRDFLDYFFAVACNPLKLFVTNYSKKLSVNLHKKAKKDIEILVKSIKV